MTFLSGNQMFPTNPFGPGVPGFPSGSTQTGAVPFSNGGISFSLGGGAPIAQLGNNVTGLQNMAMQTYQGQDDDGLLGDGGFLGLGDLSGLEKAQLIAASLGAAGNLYGHYQQGRAADRQLDRQDELDEERREREARAASALAAFLPTTYNPLREESR